jgi:hypothetical protein
MPTSGGQPLTQTVTINYAMRFHMLISSNAEAKLMSLHAFLTLQVPISSSTSTPPVRGPSSGIMETHGSVMLPIALEVADDFQTFLINFIIGGALDHGGIVATMLITGSRTGVRVHLTDVLQDFISQCTCNF